MPQINGSYTDDIGQFENTLRIRLREVGSATTRRAVVFQTSTEISETRNVNYKTLDPIHGPGTIYAYQNTSSRSYNLSGIKLISRSSEEATRNLARLNLIRSWTVPTFGKYSNSSGEASTRSSSAFSASNQDVLGAPPKVLEFSAYSDTTRRNNIYRIPTVITQLSINYPVDVDYIPTTDLADTPEIAPNQPFPAIMTIDLNLSETHSPVSYSNFSIADYRNGNLDGF